MNLNVSDILTFQRCEHEWFCRCLKRRIPKKAEAELAIGTWWHHVMSEFVRDPDQDRTSEKAIALSVQMRNELSRFNEPEAVKTFQITIDNLLHLFTHYQDPLLSYETLLLEEPLRAPLPGRFQRARDHVLCGTPDRVVRAPDGKIWNIQYKTMSDRTPVPVFVAMAERSLHELIYAFLIMDRLGIQAHQYGGTYLNVVRKLASRAAREKPETAFVQEFIPIRYSEVERGLHDVAILGDRMDAIARGDLAPVHNRMADSNRFGNVLSPYFDVRRGYASLDDDTLFMDAPNRYPELALA